MARRMFFPRRRTARKKGSGLRAHNRTKIARPCIAPGGCTTDISSIRSFTAYYQGWDLHPAQLPTRYAAVFSFFLEGLDSSAARLKNFVEKAAKATLVGDVFDDAATGQGLLNFFLRAINCGAISEAEAERLTGVTDRGIAFGSFLKILKNRTK